MEKKQDSIFLNESNTGIMLPKMIWHEMHDMDKNTILLVLASMKFDPADYIRNYDQFKRISKKK